MPYCVLSIHVTSRQFVKIKYEVHAPLVENSQSRGLERPSVKGNGGRGNTRVDKPKFERTGARNDKIRSSIKTTTVKPETILPPAPVHQSHLQLESNLGAGKAPVGKKQPFRVCMEKEKA